MSTDASIPKRTPQEHYKWQSADAQGANQAMEVLDKVRQSQMVYRGQKLSHQLVQLKNRLLFGKEAVDDVTLPDDDIKINCPEIHNHYGEDKPAAAGLPLLSHDAGAATATVAPAAGNALPGLLKIGLGALAAGTGIGAPFAIPGILSGVGEVIKAWNPPASIAPVSPGTSGPTITFGGKDYELGVEQDNEVVP